jgi:hypothetical protein
LADPTRFERATFAFGVETIAASARLFNRLAVAEVTNATTVLSWCWLGWQLQFCRWKSYGGRISTAPDVPRHASTQKPEPVIDVWITTVQDQPP